MACAYVTGLHKVHIVKRNTIYDKNIAKADKKLINPKYSLFTAKSVQQYRYLQ